jgi:hypothetical protein
MSLAVPPPGVSPLLPAASLPRVTIDEEPQRARDLLAALRNGRFPVFARWPDPSGVAIIGSARSVTGACKLASDCGFDLEHFEPVHIEFELHADGTPVRVLADAWVPM